jgi:hypothetical protein
MHFHFAFVAGTLSIAKKGIAELIAAGHNAVQEERRARQNTRRDIRERCPSSARVGYAPDTGEEVHAHGIVANGEFSIASWIGSKVFRNGHRCAHVRAWRNSIQRVGEDARRTRSGRIETSGVTRTPSSAGIRRAVKPSH